MLREEQIDLRRQRARAANLAIENVGKNRVFSDYRVTNPQTKGQYTVTVRGFDTGDNACTCPDFKSNTLGTCKHIEAVLERLQSDGEAVKRRKAAVVRPEVTLDYGAAQLRLKLQLPPRHSDPLDSLARTFFDEAGFWNGKHNYDELIAAIESVPEQVTVMSDAMDFIDREVERREMARREKELLSELDRVGGEATVRHLLKIPLYDFQARGAIFLACRGRSILGDDMGLGKTAQTMAAVELLARERGTGRVLVVAPASVKYQWEGEIRKFTDRSVQVVEGLKDAREELYARDAFYKLVNYEQVVRDLDLMNAWRPDVVVLDEAQRIKNWESKTSRAVKRLQSRYAMVLTGTPLENRLEELYSIVQFVDDRRLGPAFEFLHEHRVLDAKGNLTGYRNLDKIRGKLAPILLRRTRAEVLGQLPERTDTTRYVELTDAQRGPYEEQRVNLARLLGKGVLTDLDRKRVLACIVNMRLVCDSTFLFDKRTNVSPKLDEFAEVVEDLMSSGEHKAVVFSQWETMLHKAAEVLDRLGVGYALLHGGMQGKERRAVLERFKEEDCRLFLSTDAGGVGLNLQLADTVINLELPWNPAVLEQRIARVHRMGQSRPVRVVNFVTRGSIEERVLKAIESKRSLFGSVFDGDSDAVDFAALGTQSFLDGVREVVGLERPVAVAAPEPEAPARVETGHGLLEANVRMLEALAGWEADVSWPPALRDRAAAALRKLLDRIGDG
jgi:SNF2 family DNA or RNA helicase